MTEYEYLSLMSDLRLEGDSHVMMFFSVWSAYLLTTYVIGNKLHPIFVTLLTILYTCFLYLPARAIRMFVNTLTETTNRYYESFPDGIPYPLGGEAAIYIVYVVLIAAWLVSILFLLHIRGAFWKQRDAAGT